MKECNKIKVMLIVPLLDQGGLERICALTARLLNEIYEVHLVVFNTEGMIYDVTGVHVINLNLGAVPGTVGKIKNLFARIKKLKQLKKQYQIQVSYSFGQTANIANVLSKVQDKTMAGIRGYGAVDGKLNMTLICRLADVVASCTKVMENEINERYSPKKSVTLYNPCDLEEIEQLSNMEIGEDYKKFIEKPGKLIVSVGRAHDVKGFWHLIKSVFVLKQKEEQTKLMIIGDGDFSEYKKLAEELGIGEDVLFTGVQKNPFALIKKADAYALTSESEGFPNALVEAMAVGLPCVSVNCKTGPAEILHNNYKDCENQEQVYQCEYGVLTPVFSGNKDLDASNITKEERIFADTLEQMICDDEVAVAYREKAKKRAETFGIHSYVDELKRCIESMT